MSVPGSRAVTLPSGESIPTPGLAWVLRLDRVSAIPRAATPEHVAENAAALDVHLTAEDLAELDSAFPPPNGPRPLEVL